MTATVPYENSLSHLTDELRLLDLTLRSAAEVLRGGEPQGPIESLRGLVISDTEVEALLEESDTTNRRSASGTEALRRLAERIEARREACRVELALPSLAQRFGLGRFEERCLLLALAPEVDRKYDKLYAYVQDDITRKRPTVDLALRLFAGGLDDRIEAWKVFADHAPLVRHRLLRLTDTAPDGPQPLLSRSLKLDDRIASHLLGDTRIDYRALPHARLSVPARRVDEPECELTDRLSRLAHSVEAGEVSDRCRLIVHLRGSYGSGRHELIEAVAARLGRSLLSLAVDLSGIGGRAPDETIALAAREAFLQPAVLALRDFDELLVDTPDARSALRSLESALETYSPVTFLLGRLRYRARGVSPGALRLDLHLDRPDEGARSELWRQALAEQPVADDVQPGELASEFRFTRGQIRDSLAAARDLAHWRSRPGDRVTRADFSDAARAQANPELARLARLVPARSTWDDLVLPDDQRHQLREVCYQAQHRHTVLGEWGFGERITHGKGLAALFSGPPGTGKTLAASIVAGELGLDLFKIDLSQVVSKYIGETEKNLDRIFRAAEDSSAILFFDEADALFGKRSEVRDSHDRYANVEVSYLLQKMEENEGITILATNLRQHMDDAFIRRLASVVEFPFPDEADRERIWRVSLPSRAPVSGDVDLAAIAREVRLAGGNIKNISLAAAYYAAADGRVIRMDHLWRAARREFAKLGRTWSEPAA